MKVAYVVPRYGLEVRGGAETAARLYAEHLVADRGDEVEVFTTGALDALTWAEELAPGTTELHGVVVHRLRSTAGRDVGFHPFSGAVLEDPGRATRAEAERWVDLQGPLCPDLVDAVAASRADVVVFIPYLYYPTIRGLPTVARRSVLHPAAHDEPPLRLGVFPQLFEAAAGLAFLTAGERRLVVRRFDVAATPQVLVGLGIDRPAGPGASGSATGGPTAEAVTGGRPYLFYVGRVDDKKGTGMLARYFAAYKQRNPGPLALVLAGQVIDAPAPRDDVVLTGMIGEAAKWDLMTGATAFVLPSPWESFSIAVIEAMSAGVPVVVNGWCDATREHCERSGAGLWFCGYGQFEALVERLAADADLRVELGRHARRYVEANFEWPVISRRYGSFLHKVAERGAG